MAASNINNGTKVITCSCDHEYQDRTYGGKQRLHNGCKDGKWRCTVCNKEVTHGTTAKPKS